MKVLKLEVISKQQDYFQVSLRTIQTRRPGD